MQNFPKKYGIGLSHISQKSRKHNSVASCCLQSPSWSSTLSNCVCCHGAAWFSTVKNNAWWGRTLYFLDQTHWKYCLYIREAWDERHRGASWSRSICIYPYLATCHSGKLCNPLYCVITDHFALWGKKGGLGTEAKTYHSDSANGSFVSDAISFLTNLLGPG